MKIMVAEYSSCVPAPHLSAEGRAMLNTLVRSFKALGHNVACPKSDDFSVGIERISRECDAGIVIAPDELLYEYTKILEDSCTNLGCPSDSVRKCASKLTTSRVLERARIAVPRILTYPSPPLDRSSEGGSKRPEGTRPRYVIKPIRGCASEDISLSSRFSTKEGYITTEFIDGEHISASLIVGENTLPLTVNKQIIEMNKNIRYRGGVVPYDISHDRIRNEDVMLIAVRSAEILGCRGYIGVDFVLGNEAYVVDVNPRITTSVVGIASVINYEIADLLLRAKLGEVPEKVELTGSFSFKL
jgi:hypothetical protein